MKFDILNRFSGEVQFSAEIDCKADDLPSVKLGMAVKVALKESANLYGANLRSANLYGANLRSANLKDAKNADLVIAQTRILPSGSLIGWKKCKHDVIVKLCIPEEARRSHAFGRKCRAEFADVLEIIGAEQAVSSHDGVTVYRTGERVTPDSFDENWQEECAPGIHFFITKEEAENY